MTTGKPCHIYFINKLKSQEFETLEVCDAQLMYFRFKHHMSLIHTESAFGSHAQHVPKKAGQETYPEAPPANFFYHEMKG